MNKSRRRFDPLIERLRAIAAGRPDRRIGDHTQFVMADIAPSAFSVFFTQNPSFLSCQRHMEQTKGRNNARSLLQIERLPTDNRVVAHASRLCELKHMGKMPVPLRQHPSAQALQFLLPTHCAFARQNFTPPGGKGSETTCGSLVRVSERFVSQAPDERLPVSKI